MNYNDKDPLLSPLQDFLENKLNSQVSTIDLWFPSDQKAEATNMPILSAKSALVYDLTTDKTLYEKNPDIVLPMASITKIMTAVVAIDNRREDDRYIVKKADLVGENAMGLTIGEELTQEELLYGLVLNSANDAAEVLASNTLGRDEFIKAMNEKAKAIGMKDTNFTNPSGLEGDGFQKTTAKDLLILTRFALKNYPLFAEVSQTLTKYIPANANHKTFDMYNETNLLSSYPGVKGVKDGYTPEAGLCLVTYLDYQGHEMIAIILGSENRRQEMKDLLDYSLNKVGVKPPEHP